MRVFGMRVFGVVVVIVLVAMSVVMMVMMMILRHDQTAHTSAEGIAERTIRYVGARRRSALPFYMVVMALLHGANFRLKPQHLRAVLAHHASGRRHGAKSRMRAILGFDVMVMPVVKGQNLLTVAAVTTVGRRHCAELLAHAFRKGL